MTLCTVGWFLLERGRFVYTESRLVPPPCGGGEGKGGGGLFFSSRCATKKIGGERGVLSPWLSCA